jgi:hypothetical protein
VNDYIGDVSMLTQIIKYNKCCSIYMALRSFVLKHSFCVNLKCIECVTELDKNSQRTWLSENFSH